MAPGSTPSRGAVRVVERDLLASHTALVEGLTTGLDAETYAVATAAAAASEQVRGYEDVKLGNVERYGHTLRGLGLA